MSENIQKKRLPTLQELRKVHIIGVCGTLMGAFATYLKRRGIEVTGSDQNVYPPMSDILREGGVQLFNGYAAENITGMKNRPDLVVIGNVIGASNPEARAAIDGGYAYSSLPEAMEVLLLPRTRNIVVAGTHGKTTTSSLMAHTLARCGLDPSYFIGGVTFDLPYSFNVTDVDAGRPFVLEGDEYDTAFWDKVPKFNHYLPNDVVLTSVEFDHADIYADLAAVERAFEGLFNRVRDGGRLIACLDYESVRKLLKKNLLKSSVEVITYGSDPSHGARFTPGSIRVEGQWTHFDVLDQGRCVARLKIGLPGNHNVMNALSVWIECRRLGLDPEKVADAMSMFRGVKRRQELRGEVNGVMVIDDFAHHPTAVRETLRALKLRYPERKLVAVFEPRSATSRRKVFQKDYADAFGEAARVYIAKPYDQTKIQADDQFSSDQLVEDMRTRGQKVELMPTVDEGVALVASQARSSDLIAVLSNGGFGGFIPKLLESLKSANA